MTDIFCQVNVFLMQAGVEVASQVSKWGTVLVPGEYLLSKSPLDVFMSAWKQDRLAGKVLKIYCSSFLFSSSSLVPFKEMAPRDTWI